MFDRDRERLYSTNASNMTALAHMWYYKKQILTPHMVHHLTKKWLIDKNKMRKHSMCFMYMCFIDFQQLIMKKMLITFSSLPPYLTFPYISSFYVQPIWKVSFTIRIVKLCIVNLICLQAPHLWGELVQGKEMSLQNLYSERLWFVTFYQYSTHKATGFLLFYGRLNANDLTI